MQNNNTNKPSTRGILIVDDEPDDTTTYKLVLEYTGFRVITFNAPLLALSAFKAGMYDLALLNVKMPKMNGFELGEEIRKIDDKVKVCFITAQLGYEENLKKRLSYDKYKPFYPKTSRKSRTNKNN